MSNEKFFTSAGFEDAFDKAQWGVLQKYLAQASVLPKSQDQQTVAILEKVHNAAQTCATSVLPTANAMANTLYNFASTMVATLQAIDNLMSQEAPPKPAIEQLVASLKASATSALSAPQKVSQGLTNFQNLTAGAGHALAEKLSSLIVKVTAVNKSMTNKSEDLARQLSASTLDTVLLGNDIETIQNVAQEFNGISFVGLTFSVQPGVTTAAHLITAVKNETAAWNALIKQLGNLDVQVKQSSVAELKALPCFTPEVFQDAQNRWLAIEQAAHGFMLNFYVTTPPLSLVQSSTKS